MKLKSENMSCSDVQGLIFDYLDGELDRSTAERMSAHFAVCPDCRAELEECQRMLEAIGRLDYSAPEELHSRVMTLVSSTPQSSSRVGGFFAEHKTLIKRIGGGILPAAACIALVIGVGVMHDRQKQLELLTADNEGKVTARDEAFTGFADSETIGAIQFSAPSDGTSLTASESIDRGEAGESVIDEDHAARAEGAALDTSLKPEVQYKLNISEEKASDINALIDNFMEHDTAILLLEVDSKVGEKLGELIKLAGFEDIAFREVLSANEEALEELCSEAASELEESAVLTPEDGEFDTIVICYGLTDEVIGIFGEGIS